MAIQKFGNKEWGCLSSDDRDDILSQEKEGATLHIVDTGEEYILFDGKWEPDLRWKRRIGALG